MAGWVSDLPYIILAVVLVLLNGFFVAAEFALVKVRTSRLDELVREGRPFAHTARWLGRRLDASLSACQLGITMASLALGMVAEPAAARMLRPLLESLGVATDAAIHTISYIVVFSIITSLHLIIGEQAPKIFAIRRAEVVTLWCALPLKFFYVLFYPFLIALNGATSVLLRLFGVKGSGEHEAPHSEDEIRVLVSRAHALGELTRSEHQLVHAVFEFDDLVCRQVMVPRVEVEYLDADQSLEECLAVLRRTQHTRYPVCEGSLDEVIGVLHIKDLVGLPANEPADLRRLVRPPKRVPETLPVSRLLRHFQATHQLMAFVIDEYGTVVGVVTLENVLEQIVGPVEDEFDSEPPEFTPDGPASFIVLATTSLESINRRLKLELHAEGVDTLSGLLMAKAGRVLDAGDQIELDGATADVLETKNSRAIRVRITLVEGS